MEQGPQPDFVPARPAVLHEVHEALVRRSRRREQPPPQLGDLVVSDELTNALKQNRKSVDDVQSNHEGHGQSHEAGKVCDDGEEHGVGPGVEERCECTVGLDGIVFLGYLVRYSGL